MRAGAGADFDVKLFPLPVQPQLPVWLTCIHEDSFVKAGELGVGVLGYLMNQTVDEVAAKIAKYREALARHGHDPEKGHVTILVHTFVGDDADAARERARGPLKEYLRSFLDNSQKRLESQNGQSVDVAEEDLEYLLDKSFNDYVQGKALIGSPESCAAVVDKLREIGVDEIGCFIDFGVDPDAVLASLPALDRLREKYADAPAPPVAERTLPLTEAQSGLWVLGQTDPTNALRAYQESTTLELRGPLDTDALQRALQAAVNRHEALRALVRPDGESQVIHARGDRQRAVDRPVRQPGVPRGCAGRDRARRVRFRARPAVARGRSCGWATERHLLVLTFHHLFRQRAVVLGVLRGFLRALRGGTHRPRADVGTGDAAFRIRALAHGGSRAHGGGRRAFLAGAIRGRCADVGTARRPAASVVAHAQEAGGWRDACRRNSRPPCARSRRRGGVRCSWCCCRRSARCCTGSAARTI